MPSIEREQKIDEPRRFADLDTVAQSRRETVALARCDAPELPLNLAAFKSGDSGIAAHEARVVAVEIRFPRLKITVPAFAYPARSRHMLDKDKWTATEDMLRGVLRVGCQFRCAVDAVPGGGKVRQHRRFRPFHPKDDSARVRCLDCGDRRIARPPRRGYAGRRLDDTLVARLH